MSDTKLSKAVTYKLLAGIPEKQGEEVNAFMRDLAKRDAVLMQVAGEITGYTSKQGQFGENIGFNGEFILKSAITGEVFETTKVYFDKAFAEQVKARFDQRSESSERVQITAQVAVVSHSKAPFFTYMATPLKTAETVSRKAMLLSLLAEAPLPKLEAPKVIKK